MTALALAPGRVKGPDAWWLYSYIRKLGTLETDRLVGDDDRKSQFRSKGGTTRMCGVVGRPGAAEHIHVAGKESGGLQAARASRLGTSTSA